MNRECITKAPSVEEAVDAALEQLGVQQDAVEYEVVEEPSKKVFGMGSTRDATVRVWVKESVLAEMASAESEAGPEDEPLPAEATAVPEQAELSDEELDQVADTAAEALRRILGHFGLEGASVEEYEGDEGEIILDVVGGDLGLLIGRHGRTLDALQAAVGAVTTRQLGYRYPVVVDVEGYRHRRRQKIEDMARRAADRAARQHTAIRMRPMTAYERRVVHMILRDDRRVLTSSEGADPFRQVVVSPK